ncbi:MAG TPA: hypothetical protein VGB85_29520 [Nannocystis sp.]
MEPLDPELRRIIDEGLRQAAPGPEVEARALAGLLARISEAGQTSDTSDPGRDPTPLVSATKASALPGGLKALILATVIAGGGITIAAVTRDPPAPAVVTARPPPAPVVAPVKLETSIAAPPASRPVRVVRPAPDTLLAETRALAEADAALASGRHDLALTLAAKIARQHPKGQLVIERVAIEVSARCGLHDPGAGAGAREFLRELGDTAVAAKVRTRCAEVLR